jgi:hypothetical protein
MSKSSQRQFLVKVQGIDGLFMTKAGGNSTSDVARAYDGGSSVPDLIAAPKQVENVTVSRGFDPVRDADLLQGLRPLIGSFETTLSVTPTDRDYVAAASPIVYSPALLVGLTEPEVAADSGDLATFELEFAVADVR